MYLYLLPRQNVQVAINAKQLSIMPIPIVCIAMLAMMKSFIMKTLVIVMKITNVSHAKCKKCKKDQAMTIKEFLFEAVISLLFFTMLIGSMVFCLIAFS